ncbi:hypothetical protein GOBAR_AA28700 [Gossypium barbadense]|uniref:Uncharacterized protein n=1 Tax=Gossypium barbadense TaxID=3634 RepID=A0A2P5WLM4_GOSBA|nr:hypothetical protein GOBAR_AA28700 [Gossypium barbadense]
MALYEVSQIKRKNGLLETYEKPPCFFLPLSDFDISTKWLLPHWDVYNLKPFIAEDLEAQEQFKIINREVLLMSLSGMYSSIASLTQEIVDSLTQILQNDLTLKNAGKLELIHTHLITSLA